MQWNFLAERRRQRAARRGRTCSPTHRPGGRGVIVAVLDTGVAYRDWHQFRSSPDFSGTRFVAPVRLRRQQRFPLDREGHGTFVAGTIAESTNNGIGLTGLAYGASIMPVRILDADGTGDAATIARGIRYAATHGAQVINLSLEFSLDVTAARHPGDHRLRSDSPTSRGVVVVAAAGNEGVQQLAYPARAPAVISVGATTTRPLPGRTTPTAAARLDLVAPGGGDDTTLARPIRTATPTGTLPDIYQLTFFDSANPRPVRLSRAASFGTSMSAPHVAATAALVIASGVIGRHPTPDQVLHAARGDRAAARRLRAPNPNYGYGLLDAGAATSHDAVAALSAAYGRPHDQHRARRVVRDLVRDRAEQEALRAGHAAVADDDQIGALLLGDVEDRVGGVALARERLDLARRPRRRASCSASLEQREHVLARVDHPLEVLRDLDALVAQPLVGDRLVGADDLQPGAELARQVDRVADRGRGGVRSVGADDDRGEHRRLRPAW